MAANSMWEALHIHTSEAHTRHEPWASRVRLLTISTNENSANQNWPHFDSYPLGVFRNYNQASFAFISRKSWSGKLGAGQGEGGGVYFPDGKQAKMWSDTVFKWWGGVTGGIMFGFSSPRAGQEKVKANCGMRSHAWYNCFLTLMANRSLTAWMLNGGGCEVPFSLYFWCPILRSPVGLFQVSSWFKNSGLQLREKELWVLQHHIWQQDWSLALIIEYAPPWPPPP